MRNILLIATLAIIVTVGFNSCQKNTYCQCYATIDGESFPMGSEDLNIENMTEEQIEALQTKYQNNLSIMEDGDCNDKAKEIVGWGQVTCKEVSLEEDEGNWFERLINKITNHNQN